MEQSILKSTKKILGLAPEYTAFDLDIITHINGVFSTLAQLGVGPSGFMIEDDVAVWEDFISDDEEQLNRVKTYVFLKVRMIFDPPVTSFAIAAFEQQIEQMEWRISVHREGEDWVDPSPPVIVYE